MKNILRFNLYKPDSDGVEIIKKWLSENYKKEEFRGNTYIMIDEKPVYITGPFASRNRIRALLYNMIESEFREYADSTINKAIKEYL